MSSQTTEFFDTVAKILLRCTIIGCLLLLFWFGAVFLAGDLVFAIHGSMFDLSRHELNVIHYCGMGLFKMFVGLFFFLPWVAIRLVLKKTKD
jgi:hypothetical protein